MAAMARNAGRMPTHTQARMRRPLATLLCLSRQPAPGRDGQVPLSGRLHNGQEPRNSRGGHPPLAGSGLHIGGDNP